MSLSSTAKDPVDDDGGKSAKQSDDRRDLPGKNLLSIGDAVIVTDSVGNVILLNPAAESLTGWTDHDARDRPIETVFQIIHEVTRQPVSQPVKEVIEHGSVRNLAQFTLLIAKDGSERAIADSASPIRDESGTWTGSSSSSGTPPSADDRRSRLEDDWRHGEVIIAAVQRLPRRPRRQPAGPVGQSRVLRDLPHFTGRDDRPVALRPRRRPVEHRRVAGAPGEHPDPGSSSGEFQVERDFPTIGRGSCS